MKDTSVQNQLQALREQFLTRLQDDCAAMGELLDQIGRAEPGSDRHTLVLGELQQRLHRLAGTAGTFGFTELGDQARLAEHRLEARLSQVSSGCAELQDVLSTVRQLIADPPLSSSQPAPAPAVTSAVSPCPSPFSILLMEPDARLAEDVQRQLAPFGFTVELAPVSAFLSGPDPGSDLPALLFVNLDALLIETDGAEPDTSQWAGSALLVYSATDEFDQRLLAARMGVEGYFTQPLDIPRAIGFLVRVLDSRQKPAPRILLVEDDELLARRFSEVLQQAGMEVHWEEDPRAVIETVAEFQPDLVLLDLHMPQVAGDEVAAVLRQYEMLTTLPIMYISAETDQQRQAAAMRRGADDFLTKPVSDDTLIMSIMARVERAREMRTLISRDGMTGLLKHSSFLEAGAVELERSRRQGYNCVVVMLDIDHFKRVNDTWGHATGDTVIRAIATLLRQRLRQTDLTGRYGGEEFAAVLADCALADAVELLEAVRQRFAEIDFNTESGDSFRCTLSVGLTQADPGQKEAIGALIERADQALYDAKRAGRNRLSQR